MPITYRFDPELWLVDAQIGGPVGITDLHSFIQQMVDERLFEKELRFLGTIAGMEPQFTSADLVRYQEWRKQFPQFARMALVAGTEHEFGVARQFELATNAVGGAEMRVFRAMKEARAWLGLPDP